MPEFKLPMGSNAAGLRFWNLDSFTRGYIKAMFWTDANTADDGELEDATFEELAPEALKAIETDCVDFNLKADAWLYKAYTRGDMSYSSEQAGHDFWLTRNRHGAGFWDRGLGSAGEKLSEISESYREVDLYRGDDGLIYIS